MAKTVNPDMDIFDTLAQAQRKFDKEPAPVALIQAREGFFIDRKGTGPDSAIEAWPKRYTLIDEKKV